MPAANVKVHSGLWSGLPKWQKENPNANPHFTQKWIEQHVSEEQIDSLFWGTCEYRWEDLQQEAEEIWPDNSVKVYSEGRSGGWAAVAGLSDVEDWDAIDLARWRRFERYARATADYIPVEMIESVYINEFDAWVRA
jgi:hypothetical protein